MRTVGKKLEIAWRAFVMGKVGGNGPLLVKAIQGPCRNTTWVEASRCRLAEARATLGFNLTSFCPATKAQLQIFCSKNIQRQFLINVDGFAQGAVDRHKRFIAQ